MSRAFTFVAIVLAVLVAVVGWAYLRARALRPAVYRHLSVADLAPFLRSWAVWLGNRGDIFVGREGTEAIVQFRNRTYRRRPNILFFRYRNADGSRRSFPVVRAALDTAGVDYQLELTPRTRQPRALVVPLDPGDVLMPAAATRLIDIVFGALPKSTEPGFLIWSVGPFQRTPDREEVPLVAPVVARRAGFRVGVVLGKIVRAVLLPRRPQ